MARSRYGEALRWIDALLNFAPMHATGLAAKAMALKKLDRLEPALEAAERAIAAAPENAEAHNAHGLILQALGRPAEARAAYDRATGLPGTAAEQALINQAILLMEQGETAAAEAAFDGVTTLFPRSASAWFNRADVRKFEPDDPALHAMRTLLDSGEDIAVNDRMLLHFALGKAYLDIGDSARALGHLDEGNRMKRATISYDPAAVSQWMSNVAAMFTPELLARLAGAGPESPVPVFVVGMPRSGTTLVEQILASHNAIHGAGELGHIQGMVTGLGEFPAFVETLTPEQLRQLGQSYLDKVVPLARGEKRHVVDKMPVNFVYAGLIRMILPEARIIHCRRDPVDTCLSCYSKLFGAEQSFSYDQTEVGLFHRDYQKLTAHWREVLPATHFLEVDYEAVVDDVQAQARRMLEFLGLDWDPACVDFHKTKRPIKTASVNQVRRPVYRSSAGRWKRHAAQLGPLLAALQVVP
jgi:tetratricopeptide (TPR) repeat protein